MKLTAVGKWEKRGAFLSKCCSRGFFIGFILLLLMTMAVPALAARGKKENNRRVPASLLRLPEGSSPYAVLVDKSVQKVFLYHKENLFKPLKTYDCSTGENVGPKTVQNDRRTPEGIYFFTKSYEKKYLSPIYGNRAFPIDYPNPIDKTAGRNGYGIWFHGTNKPLKPRDSNGCIVLEDASIDQLASYIKLHETPTVISSTIKMVPVREREREAEKLAKLIEEWRQAWERKAIGKYMSFYSPKFTAQGKDWSKWKNHKRRLAEKYKTIHVEIDNLRLLKNDGVLLATFTQNYSTKSFRSLGEKRLYLHQNSREWKIVGEIFKEAGTKPTVIAKKPAVSDLEEIEKVLYRWRRAWEQKDINSYMACYDPNFYSRGMDYRAWRKHRSTLNREHGIIKVKIRGLKINKTSGTTAKATFRQSYRADRYRDYGLKNIFFSKTGQNWKIKKEEWQALGRKARR
ncbi:L,D-transpeptidase family protein [Thermodesulfobacteriota bacterium]